MMTDDEKKTYMTNLIALAKADEVVVLEESTFLGRVAKRLDVDRTLIAGLLGGELESMTIDLQPLTRFSDRARCLEDMIELAMIDGDVALNEKKVLLVTAQRVGIDKDTVAV